MKVSEHQYDRGIKGEGIYNLSYGSQHELLYSLIEILSMQMTACLASSATPLTFSMEEIHMSEVCI